MAPEKDEERIARLTKDYERRREEQLKLLALRRAELEKSAAHATNDSTRKAVAERIEVLEDLIQRRLDKLQEQYDESLSSMRERAAKRREKAEREAPEEEVIFRTIAGRVVPIKVKR